MKPAKLTFKTLLLLAGILYLVSTDTHSDCQAANFDYKNDINSDTTTAVTSITADGVDAFTMELTINPGPVAAGSCYTRVLTILDAFGSADQTLTITTAETNDIEAFGFALTEEQIKTLCIEDTRQLLCNFKLVMTYAYAGEDDDVWYREW